MNTESTTDLTQVHPFFNLINQIALTSEEPHLYFVALLTTLAIPDICGALESSDGLATGAKYKAWFDQWVSHKYSIQGTTSLTGHDCYMLRCAALHQGRMSHPNANNHGVIFLMPGASGIIAHNNLLNGYLNIDIHSFCTDMVQSAADWFSSVVDTQPFEDNFSKSMRVHFNGFGPIHGVPVIG